MRTSCLDAGPTRRLPRLRYAACAALGLLLAAAAGAAPPADHLTPAAAAVDPMTVSIQAIRAADALALRRAPTTASLLIDLRPGDEAGAGGLASPVDARLSPAEAQQPARIRALLAFRGGDHATPLLLLGRDGQDAADVARALVRAGFTGARPILDGEAGWIAAQPQQAAAPPP